MLTINATILASHLHCLCFWIIVCVFECFSVCVCVCLWQATNRRRRSNGGNVSETTGNTTATSVSTTPSWSICEYILTRVTFCNSERVFALVLVFLSYVCEWVCVCLGSTLSKRFVYLPTAFKMEKKQNKWMKSIIYQIIIKVAEENFYSLSMYFMW